MKKDVKVYLNDIKDSCERITSYIKDKDKSDFDSNLELQDAIIRRLIIIGEVIKRLPEQFRQEHGEIAWRKAAGMRDVLIPLRENPRDLSPWEVERVFSLRWGFQLSTKRTEKFPVGKYGELQYTIMMRLIPIKSGELSLK